MPADRGALDGGGDSAQAGADRHGLEGLPTIQNLGMREVVAAMMPPRPTHNELARRGDDHGGLELVWTTTRLIHGKDNRHEFIYIPPRPFKSR